MSEAASHPNAGTSTLPSATAAERSTGLCEVDSQGPSEATSLNGTVHPGAPLGPVAPSWAGEVNALFDLLESDDDRLVRAVVLLVAGEWAYGACHVKHLFERRLASLTQETPRDER